MRNQLQLKPKTYQIISDLLEDKLREENITREQIDIVINYMFEFIKEYFKTPIKGLLYIKGFGSFEVRADRILKRINNYIQTFRKNKLNGEEYNPQMVNTFRNMWRFKPIAIQYVANKGVIKKGFYKPINIKTNTIIPKKKRNEYNK